MRRGLIQWDKHEYAAERIDAHIAAARKLLDERQLDAVVAYTDHSRPTTVWTFTQYVPYWATGAVIISRAHPSALVLTLSKRGLEWVKSVCRADYFTTGPSLPGGIRQYFEAYVPMQHRRVGVIDLANATAEFIEAFQAPEPFELVDLSNWYQQTVAPELAPEALARKVYDIGARALAEVVPSHIGNDPYALAALIDGSCRRAGAEEVHLTIAPDLGSSPNFLRPEGVPPLGGRYAVQLGLAYKGLWIRLGRTWQADGSDPLTADEKRWLNSIFSQLGDGRVPGEDLGSALQARPAAIDYWMLECPRMGLPMSVIASSMAPDSRIETVQNPALTCLSLSLKLDRGWWHVSGPLDALAA